MQSLEYCQHCAQARGPIGQPNGGGQHTPNFSYRWIGSWWFVSPTVSLPNLDHIELTVNTSLRF